MLGYIIGVIGIMEKKMETTILGMGMLQEEASAIRVKFWSSHALDFL